MVSRLSDCLQSFYRVFIKTRSLPPTRELSLGRVKSKVTRANLIHTSVFKDLVYAYVRITLFKILKNTLRLTYVVLKR